VTDHPSDTSGGRWNSILDGYTSAEIEEILEDLPGGQSVSEATRRLHRDLRKVLVARRREPVPPSPLTLPGMDEMVYSVPHPVRPVPTTRPEVGHIVSRQDPAGRYGVGVIGSYLVAPDGATVYRLFGGPPQDQPRWVFYDKPGTQPFEQINGFGGTVVLVPLALTPEE
jgi:hypothetical protein